MDLQVLLVLLFSTCTTPYQKQKTYDFIIVGGGTAGSVLATRLSEISSWNVLVLEAGGWNRLLNQLPAVATRYQGSSVDWNYQIEPQTNSCLGLKQRKLFWPAGKVLGGTSEINYMVYTRGNKDDYDRWEREGNPGWGYRQVLPYFLKSEHYKLKSFDGKYHNDAGEMSIRYAYHSNVTSVFFEAAKELGYSIQDYNQREQIGFSRAQINMGAGKRHSVFKAFLQPVSKTRKNLDVITSARVTKVITNGGKSARGVVYIKNGKAMKAFASREIILSAGVVGSSKILLLSGIGPKNHLEELQIPLVQDLQVGQSVRDHISYFGLNYLAGLPVSFNQFSYLTGVYSCSNARNCIAYSPAGIESLGFVTLNASEANPNVPDVEILLANHLITKDLKTITNMKEEVHQKFFENVEEVIAVNIFPVLLHPQSKGSVKLRSKHPSHPPVIQPNYLSSKEDVRKMIQAMRFVEKLTGTESFNKVDAALYPIAVCEGFEMDSDEYWECAARTLTMTFGDYMGGCRMGPSTDKEAVVDDKLQVYGMKKLMVVDASVIPVTISGHIGAAVVMIAEKAVDVIKEKHSSSFMKYIRDVLAYLGSFVGF